MPEPLATLVLETSFRVPGLGVLVVPTSATAAALAAHALHTALAITLQLDNQPATALTGTVEELAHAGQPPRRALLLDFDPGEPLSSGTRLQVAHALPSLL